MSKNRSLAIITVMITVTTILIFIFLTIYKRGEIGPYNKTPEEAEIEEIVTSYDIPDNAIPTQAEIQEAIQKNKETASFAKEKAVEKKPPVRQISQVSEPEPVPGAVGEAKKISAYAPLPAKKEVRFPTFTERKSRESSSSIAAY